MNPAELKASWVAARPILSRAYSAWSALVADRAAALLRANPPADLPPAMLETLAGGQTLDGADLAWAISRWGFDVRAKSDPLVRELEVELRELGIDDEQLMVTSERSPISPPTPSPSVRHVTETAMTARDGVRIDADPDSILDRPEHIGRAAEDVEMSMFLGRVERESDRICGRGPRGFRLISGRRPDR